MPRCPRDPEWVGWQQRSDPRVDLPGGRTRRAHGRRVVHHSISSSFTTDVLAHLRLISVAFTTREFLSFSGPLTPPPEVHSPMPTTPTRGSRLAAAAVLARVVDAASPIASAVPQEPPRARVPGILSVPASPDGSGEFPEAGLSSSADYPAIHSRRAPSASSVPSTWTMTPSPRSAPIVIGASGKRPLPVESRRSRPLACLGPFVGTSPAPVALNTEAALAARLCE